MLVHATGFHGRCWAPLASVLSRHYTVWAIDQRGHGQSGKSPDGRYDDWEVFAADLLAAVNAIGGTGWRAGGWSLGGGVSLLAEARRPGTFSAICCYEPVVIPPGTFETPASAGPTRSGNPLAALARKRRPTFSSRQEALDNYRSKPPFSTFTAEALESYVEYGFVDLPDGTVGLACVREDEAAVFEGAITSPTWSVLDQVRPPVAILAGSDPDEPLARVAADVARKLPRAGLRRFPHLDHFGPMTAPDEVGEVMEVALAPGVDPAESTMAVTSPK